EELMALARAGNVYFDAKKPWAQRKTDLPACATTLNVCLQTVKALAILMAPFLPHSASKTLAMLNLPAAPESLHWNQAVVPLPVGHKLGEPVILFKKLDAKELLPSAPV